MMVALTDSSLTWALNAASHALEEVDASYGQLELLRAGSAITLGAGQLVARCTESVNIEELRWQLDVAYWLNDHGVRAVIPADPNPIETPYGTVTLWKREHVLDGSPGMGTLGTMLATIHRMPLPSGALPLDPLDVTTRRIARLAADQRVSDATVQTLDNACADARELWEQERSDVLRLVHGDITGNVLNTDNGWVLCDFENTGAGDPIFDIARVMHRIARFESAGKAEDHARQLINSYAFAGGPGHIARAFKLLPLIDVIGTAWALECSLITPERFNQEAAIRLRTLQSGTSANWRPR